MHTIHDAAAPRVWLHLSTVVLALTARSLGLDISYCSPDNNAGSYPAYYNQYQSNGACQQHCQGSFAFAVLQGSNCWCSNYIPADQESTYNCNDPCPGFGSEWCGSTEAGLYGYFQLGQGVALGTSGAPGSGASSTSSSSGGGGGGGSSNSNSRTSSSFQSLVSSPTPSPTPSPSPTQIYTSVTTVTGEVRTVIITPSPTTDATLGQSATGDPSGGGGGVSTGKVVGIVLGVALGIGLLIGIGVWLWFRQRHRRELANGSDATYLPRTGDTSPSNNVPSRQVSQLSSSGLLGIKTPRINTSGMPQGNDPRSADTSSSGFDRRSLATDQRLNPYALYIHDESRLSDVSLQDNQDYSRQLRVANPDP